MVRLRLPKSRMRSACDMVGLRSRATGVACLETFFAWIPLCARFMDVQRRSRGSATLPRHAYQYANTPNADTGPNCGLSRSSKLNSKNNDSTKVWENLTEANDGDLLSTIGLDSEPTASTRGVQIDAERRAVRFLCNVVDKK